MTNINSISNVNFRKNAKSEKMEKMEKDRFAVLSPLKPYNLDRVGDIVKITGIEDLQERTYFARVSLESLESIEFLQYRKEESEEDEQNHVAKIIESLPNIINGQRGLVTIVVPSKSTDFLYKGVDGNHTRKALLIVADAVESMLNDSLTPKQASILINAFGPKPKDDKEVEERTKRIQNFSDLLANGVPSTIIVLDSDESAPLARWGANKTLHTSITPAQKVRNFVAWLNAKTSATEIKPAELVIVAANKGDETTYELRRIKKNGDPVATRDDDHSTRALGRVHDVSHTIVAKKIKARYDELQPKEVVNDHAEFIKELGAFQVAVSKKLESLAKHKGCRDSFKLRFNLLDTISKALGQESDDLLSMLGAASRSIIQQKKEIAKQAKELAGVEEPTAEEPTETEVE
jgi:hypothetical protein